MPAPTPAIHHDESHEQGLETLARVTLRSDDSLRAVLHAASVLTSQGGLVVYIGGPLDDADARTLAALRQPGSTGAAMVVDPDAFTGRGRRGGGEGTALAKATIAGLTSSGWLATLVDAQTTPPLAWAAVVGAHAVGAR